MRAIQRVQPGRAELREVAQPIPGDDDVRVDVLYAAINPFDLQVLRGEVGSSDQPITLGSEATGLVGTDLVQISGGGIGVNRPGTFADTVVVPQSSVRRLPEGADVRAAATVGVAGKTAWRAVHQLGEVTASDVVLVLGGSGGVGGFAAQLARAAGAEVIVQTASADKASAISALGMETLIADSARAAHAALAHRSVSVVLDPLGGDYVSTLLPSLRAGARVVTYGVLAGATTGVDLGQLYRGGIRWLGTSGRTTPAEASRDAIDNALRAVLCGDVVVPVEVLALDAGPAAFQRLTERSVLGKLVFEVVR